MHEFSDMDASGMREPSRLGADAPDLLARGLARSVYWVLGAVGLGALIGLALGLLQPNQYSSTTKLMLRSGAREQLTSESLVGLDGGQLAAPPSMHDEMQMLRDPAIMEQVAAKLGPAQIVDPEPARGVAGKFAPSAWMQGLQKRFASWLQDRRGSEPADDSGNLRLATRILQEDTQVENEFGSNVIVVTHVSTSPERARTVAAAVADAFIERHRAHFSIQFLVESARAKLEHARAVRDQAANEYLENVNQTGFAEVDSMVPALTAEIQAMEKELFDAANRKQAISAHRAKLSGRLEDVPAEITVLGPVVMVPNEEYETQLMIKREALARKQQVPLENRTIAETRRLIAQYDAQIADADKRLQSIPRTVAQNPEQRENAAHSALSNRVEDLDLEENELNLKVTGLEQRLVEKRKQLSELRKQILAQTLRQQDLQSKREAEEASYKQALERFTMVDALGKIEQQEQPNLRVLQAATFEPEKIGPKRVSLMLKGLFAGLLAGVAFAVLRQRLDRKVHRPETIESVHGLPVLGVVPDVSALHPSWTRALAPWSSRP